MWSRRSARKGESTSVYRVLVGKRLGKRLLGIHSCSWEDNIKMGLQKWDVGAWIGLIWLQRSRVGRYL